MLRHSESNGYLRAYCEKPGINAAGRTPRFWHGGGYVHDLTVREPSLPLLARRIACHSGVPCHHSWGCEPRSGVEPPTREPHDGFLPCMHSDAMSAAIRGPGAPEAVGGQPLLHGALLEWLEGRGLCHSAHPYQVLALFWIMVLASARRKRVRQQPRDK